MLSANKLKECLSYNPDSGVFIRLKATKRDLVGKEAGHRNKVGYVVIKLGTHVYKAHRLAFLYMTGKLPENEIDHVNGIKWDNSWKNLRQVTHSVNMQNITKLFKSNKTGFTGVSVQGSKYKAQKIINGKKTHLGMYDTPEEAYEAYKNKGYTSC